MTEQDAATKALALVEDLYNAGSTDMDRGDYMHLAKRIGKKLLDVVEHDDLAAAIVEHSMLRGDFLLKSGQRSSYYFDKYSFESAPHLLDRVAKRMEVLVSPGILAGLELGGVPLATALSLRLRQPLVLVRKERKTYGTCRIAEGCDVKGRVVTVVEDVITSGGSVLDAVGELRAAGAQVSTVACVIARWPAHALEVMDCPQAKVFRNAGLEVRAVFGLKDLEPYMETA